MRTAQRIDELGDLLRQFGVKCEVFYDYHSYILLFSRSDFSARSLSIAVSLLMFIFDRPTIKYTVVDDADLFV